MNLVAQPLVLDNGSGVVKAGLAGGAKPTTVFANLVGRPKHRRVMGGGLEGSVVGARAEEYRGLLHLSHPVEHGVVKDWSAMEEVWRHAYQGCKCNPEDHPLLLTEPALNPRQNREKAAETLFETFNVPSAFFATQAVLSLYASGRTSGLVLDVGDGVSHVVPVVEGFAVDAGIVRSEVAGRDVTEHLLSLLRRAGYSHLHTSAEFEMVRQMKEQLCHVTTSAHDDTAGAKQFTLPDNTVVHLDRELYLAPEVLFDPRRLGCEYLGVGEMCARAISRVDVDLRTSLYSNVLLSGGSTLFDGFVERLVSELKRTSPTNTHVRVFAPPERQWTTWIGGSVLAGLPSFQGMCITRKQFDDAGAAAIYRKTL